jgi:hypothetical protein
MPAPQYRRRVLALATAALALAACGDDDNGTGPAPSSRTVRYEVSGTFTGGLTVVHTNAAGGNATATITTLPWSREVTHDATVAGVGIGATGAVATPGQTVTLRIVINGTAVQSGTATVAANGTIAIPTLAHVFR